MAPTVDGSEIRRSPVEVGSLSMFIPLFTVVYTSQVVVWDFFHQQYQSSLAKWTSQVWQHLASNEPGVCLLIASDPVSLFGLLPCHVGNCIDGCIHDTLLSLPMTLHCEKTCLLWHRTFLSSCLSWHVLMYCYDLLQIHCGTCYYIAQKPCNPPFSPWGKGFFCTPACYWDSLPDMDWRVV